MAYFKANTVFKCKVIWAIILPLPFFFFSNCIFIIFLPKILLSLIQKTHTDTYIPWATLENCKSHHYCSQEHPLDLFSLFVCLREFWDFHSCFRYSKRATSKTEINFQFVSLSHTRIAEKNSISILAIAQQTAIKGCSSSFTYFD